MSNPMNTVGLKDRLRKAMSEAEIVNLLAEGETYESASRETRNDWLKIADKRREALKVAAAAKARRINETPAETKKSAKKNVATV